MPNWCECDLTIEGPKARVEEFLSHAKGEAEAFDFSKFIPYPEEFARLDSVAREWDQKPEPKDWKERPKDGFNEGGYEWRVLNWGTKWNACRVQVQAMQVWDESASVEINFETAWSPPLPVIERASEMFPELEFELRYFECGMGFNGLLRCKDGEVEMNESGDYFGDRGG